MAGKRVQCNARLPIELHTYIKTYAKRTGRSFNGTMIIWLEIARGLETYRSIQKRIGCHVRDEAALRARITDLEGALEKIVKGSTSYASSWQRELAVEALSQEKK